MIRKVVRMAWVPRERVQAALEFRPVDVPPLQVHPSPAGLFEHGQKLVDLMRRCGHDFGPLDDVSVPSVPPEDFDDDGRYHKIETDAWGTTWEYRIYGVWGHRKRYPLDDIAKLESYSMPPCPRLEGEELAQERQRAEEHQRRWYLVGGGVSLFETMQNLRPFDDVLVDVMLDTPGIGRLADRLVERSSIVIENALAAGVDAVSVGDDFGTQRAPLFPPEVWRRFFKPRYEALLEPVVRAGRKVLFHSCGAIGPLLEDLRDVGADAIWPQLPLFDLPDLAQRCRELGLAVQLHPDRGELMQRGSPQEVRERVLHLVETFECRVGGSWLYVEIDPGFPWPNVEALFETVMALR